MATITSRPRKDGTLAHTAQIRITQNGKIEYTESRTLTDLEVLTDWAARREAELRQPGALERERHKGTTVADVLGYYRKDFERKVSFGRTKGSHIDFMTRHALGKLDAIQLTASQLIEHAYSRAAKGAEPATINNDFVWLRNAFRAVRLSQSLPLDVQVIDDATFILRKERVIGKAKQRERRPTLEELNKLLTYFADRDGRADLPMVDLVLFALFSTRRQAEITRLRRSDIDKRRNGILVRDMKHPREKKDTFCVLTDPAWAIIERQPKVGGEDRIFPYVSKSISAAFTRTCNFLGIEDLTFHDLRHEGVSWLFEQQWDIPRVSAVSGHKSWSSLQRYTHLREYGYHDKYAEWEWLPLLEN